MFLPVTVEGQLHLLQPLRHPVLPRRVGVGGTPCHHLLELGVGQGILVHEPTDHRVYGVVRAEAVGLPAVPALDGVGGGLPVGQDPLPGVPHGQWK